jgi:hypothetical protein
MRAHDLGVVPAWNVHLPGDVIGRVLEGWHLGEAVGKKRKDWISGALGAVRGVRSAVNSVLVWRRAL